MKFVSRGWGLALIATVGLRAQAAERRPLTPDPLTDVAPVPSLVAFATAHRIPLTGIDLAEAGAAPRTDDQVTLLVTLVNGAVSQQWLACLTSDALTEKESRLKPPDAAVIHTSTGLALRYTTTRAAVRIKFIGPFGQNLPATRAPDETALVKTARTLVSPEYLNSGFAGYCRSALEITPRVNAAGAKPHYSAGSLPRSAEEIQAARPFNDAVHLTPEEERLDFGVYFSVVQFFSAACKVAAFQDVLLQVVNKPSLWSAITHLGVRMDLNFWWMDVQAVSDGRIGVALPAYQFPLKVFLNGALGVKATLAVTTPRPPLQTCAGIVALCIEHPTDENKRVFIRLIAARHAATVGP